MNPEFCDFKRDLKVYNAVDGYGGPGKFGTQYKCNKCGLRFTVSNEHVSDNNFIEERFSYIHFLHRMPTNSDSKKFETIISPCESCMVKPQHKVVQSKIFYMKIHVCNDCAEHGAEPPELVKRAREGKHGVDPAVKVWTGDHYIEVEKW